MLRPPGPVGAKTQPCLPGRWPRWLGATAIAIALWPCVPQFAVAMDLITAYRLALENDATLRAARAAADVQRERLPQAQAQLLPNLTVSAARSYNDITRTQANLLGRPVTTDEQYYSHNGTLTLRQPLYRPALLAGVEQARALVADADATLQAEVQNVASRVTGAYLESLFAQDQLDLVRQQIRVARVQLDAAQKSWQAGTGIRTDVDEIQARLDVLLADELKAQQQIDLTRRQLEVLTGTLPQPLHRVDPARLALSDPEPATLAAWLERAEQHSPELQALRARSEAARHEVDRARATHLPTLDAVAQIARSASENVTSPSSSYTNRLIGLQFTLPLYAGGAVQSAIRQALAELTRTQEALEAARRELGVRVHREYRAVVEGVRRVRALERAVASAELVVTSNRRSYEAGTRTVIDVLNAEQQKQVALRDLAQARYEYLIARVRLAALAGDSVEQTILDINAALAPAQ